MSEQLTAKFGLSSFFAAEGKDYVNLTYWSPDVEVKWTIGTEGDDSLQVIYERKSFPKEGEKQEFWLYLAPHDARVIGEILLAFAASQDQ